MSRITSEEIAEYLKKIGWSYTVADRTTVMTAYACEIPHYFYQIPISLSASQYWVTIRGVLQGRARRSRELLALLNELNSQSHQARFLHVRGSAIVQAEVPASRCDTFHFYESLSAVCHYANRYGLEVSVMATATSPAKLYAQVLDSEDRRFYPEPETDDDDWQLSVYSRANRLDEQAMGEALAAPAD